MSRIVSVWLPRWPIDRLRRRAPGNVPETEPFALVEKGTHGLRISAVNALASAAGVSVGAALPDVRAALPSLAVRPAEPEHDREALLALAGWLTRYGPVSNVDGAEGMWVDVTGVPHLFGGEGKLCADLAERLAGLGLVVRIGLADTLGAAHALARFVEMPPGRPWVIAPMGEVKAALAPLPVASLRIAPDAVRLLVRLGLKRIGQLYPLPRATIAARFREAGRRGARGTADVVAAELLLRLDQALGIAREPRPSLVPPPEASSRLAFPEPLLTAEGVGSALGKLVLMLTEKLARQGLGARRFRLALYRADGTVAEAVVGTSMANRDPLHLQRLMADRLSILDAGFGIDVVILEAGRLEPLEPRQMGLQAASLSPAEASAALVDRLVSRLGRTRVRVRVCKASHVPERAEHWMPAMDIAKAGTAPPFGKMSANSRAESRETPWGHLARRPALLLSPPEPISVIAEIPEGAPQHFVWRRLARRIVKSEGPQRIAPEWWRHIGTAKSMPGTRDYYRLEDTTGARYWVFREGLYGDEESISESGDADADAPHREVPRWFVHGLFG